MNRKSRKSSGPQHRYILGDLACQRCGERWTVVDLNEQRKVVKCPVCAEPNDVNEAIKRAA